MGETGDGVAEARLARIRWVWRGVTVAWAAAAIGVSLRLRRESLDSAVLARDEDALRRACLGFPLPIMLQASRVHRFLDPDTGTQTLSYRLPADRPSGQAYGYYDDYLRRSGFSLAVRGTAEALRGPIGAGAAHTGTPAGDGAGATRVYTHADHLREATVSVRAEPLRGGYRTVVVTVRPA